jgi:hypothetical protein
MIDVEKYLEQLQSEILAESNWKPVLLTKEWITQAPNQAGVYVLRLLREKYVIYVGETGDLRGRMSDLTKTLNHSCRRSLGKYHFSTRDGFVAATSKKKFPKDIEQLLDDYMKRELEVACLPVRLGRKELEEKIEKDLHVMYRLNKRGKRKV